MILFGQRDRSRKITLCTHSSLTSALSIFDHCYTFLYSTHSKRYMILRNIQVHFKECPTCIYTIIPDIGYQYSRHLVYYTNRYR